MSLEATIWAWEQVRSLDPRSALVLLRLADYVRPHERTCFPGQARLAEETGQSERTVRRAIHDLEQRELIQRHRRMHPEGGRKSDEYELYGPAFVGPEDLPANLAGMGLPALITGLRGSLHDHRRVLASIEQSLGPLPCSRKPGLAYQRQGPIAVVGARRSIEELRPRCCSSSAAGVSGPSGRRSQARETD